MATDTVKQNWEIIWPTVFFLIYVHCAGLYGMYCFFTYLKWATWVYAVFVIELSNIGVAVGAHRLWAHRSYKAKLPLRIFLAYLHTMTLQRDIYSWCRDHRLHHQYSETDADPHNASRGFFFAHIGWLMLRKSKSVITKGKALDLSDLEADPVITYQRKYYWYIAPWVAFIIPAALPWYFWGEPFSVTWFCAAEMKFIFTLHLSSLVNSAAHLWGTKPYDKNIFPVENQIVNYLTNGEAFHNYHHTFPWDYKAAELGGYYWARSTLYIDLLAKMGLAYDLKSAPPEIIEKRAWRTGDGSRNKGICQ